MSWMRQKQREAAGEQKRRQGRGGPENNKAAAPWIKQKHRKKRALCFQFREQYNKQA